MTANALGYALNIPVLATNEKEKNSNKQKFSIVHPEYSREPNITQKKGK